jgi:hypothetical protein
VAKVTGLAGAITGLTGTAGLLALGKASATNVDRLGKLSTQLGISGTEVQKLQLQAELSGLKLDDLAKSFQRVTRLTGDAIAGSKEAGKIFDRLGLSTKALAESSPAKNFEAVILRLGKMRDATKRASIGNKLFEEQWQRLNPFIEGFVENGPEASRIFDKLGFGIDELSPRLRRAGEIEGIDMSLFRDATGDVEEMNDAMSKLMTRLTAFRDLFFSAFSPTVRDFIIDLTERLDEMVTAAGGADKLAAQLVEKTVRFGERAAEQFAKLNIEIGGVVEGIKAIVSLADSVVTGVRSAAATAQGMIIGDPVARMAQLTGQAPVNDAFSSDKSIRELEQINQTLREMSNFGSLVFNQ